jgi:transposase
VIGPSGRRIGSQVVETNAGALIEVVRAIPKSRHLCFEEGTLAEWLHEVLEPHVQELVVAGVEERRGPKSDKRDAFDLAEQLRIGSINRRVFKGRGAYKRLGSLAKAHGWVTRDAVRVKNRIKSAYRARGIACGQGTSVYAKSERASWLSELPDEMRPLVRLLYEEHDRLASLKAQAKHEMLAEARHHPAWHLVKSCPGLGDIRAAELVPVVITPYRFQRRSRFWSYCGLGIVMRSSSDWVRARDGRWVRAEVRQTRGLNLNFNRMLKKIFKGAATSIIRQASEQEPLYEYYLRLLDGGTKPNLAKLSLARRIAAITLAVWRTGEPYDPSRLKPMN